MGHYGTYIQEQAAIRDRMFLTAAIRQDQNSAFGSNFQQVVYPKFAVSWLASDASNGCWVVFCSEST